MFEASEVCLWLIRPKAGYRVCSTNSLFLHKATRKPHFWTVGRPNKLYEQQLVHFFSSSAFFCHRENKFQVKTRLRFLLTTLPARERIICQKARTATEGHYERLKRQKNANCQRKYFRPFPRERQESVYVHD